MDDVIDRLHQLNRRYAVLRNGSHVGIMCMDQDPATGDLEPVLGMTASGFRLLLQDERVLWQGRSKNLADVWLGWEHRRTYEGLVFDPSSHLSGPGKWNLWSDWSSAGPDNHWQGVPEMCGFYKFLDAEKYERVQRLSQDRLELLCSGYLHLIKDVIAGNQKDESRCGQLYDYLLNWCADALQFPERHPRVVGLILRGSEGTGKGVFAGCLGSLYGSHFFHLTGRHGMITDRFNSWLRHNLLIFSDEAVWGGIRLPLGKSRHS